MLYLFWQVMADLQCQVITFWAFFAWVVILSRIVKYLGHFSRHPEDVKYVLFIPLFGYFHSIVIKIYAGVTMHIVSLIPLDPFIPI